MLLFAKHVMDDRFQITIDALVQQLPRFASPTGGELNQIRQHRLRFTYHVRSPDSFSIPPTTPLLTRSESARNHPKLLATVVSNARFAFKQSVVWIL